VALTDGLLDYYALDEASGSALDAHGSKNLTDNNAVAATTGKVSGARTFDGSADSFSHTSNLLNGCSAFSVACWLQLTRGSANFRNDVAARSNDGSTTGDGWGLDLDGGSGGAKLRFYKTIGFGTGTATADAAISVSTWYHVVGTVATDGTVRLYINGTLQTATGTKTGTVSNATETRVGCDPSFGGSSFWQGPVDELGFWNRELTGSEVTSLYNGGSGLAYPLSTGTADSGGPFLLDF
jgi:hypothetical protein